MSNRRVYMEYDQTILFEEIDRRRFRNKLLLSCKVGRRELNRGNGISLISVSSIGIVINY